MDQYLRAMSISNSRRNIPIGAGDLGNMSRFIILTYGNVEEEITVNVDKIIEYHRSPASKYTVVTLEQVNPITVRQTPADIATLIRAAEQNGGTI
jgi:hypothetical protein